MALDEVIRLGLVRLDRSEAERTFLVAPIEQTLPSFAESFGILLASPRPEMLAIWTGSDNFLN